jgi:L-seryl-tRNA(Ser) seleniumtransferase
MDCHEALQSIPAVERVLQEPLLRAALEQGDLPRKVTVEAVRDVLEDARRAIRAGETVDLDPARLARAVVGVAHAKIAPRLVRVVNASGVVLHTNLGRAPLGCEAMEAMQRVMGYCNIEYDLAKGRRGYRHDSVEGLIRELTGAEAALVTNNNAAAVLLALTALARGREVVVSRGELVEIGGAFRVPDVMVQSGGLLREVGTTNKTYLRDYEHAITPETALLLKVHRSNYRILGFTAEVSLAELVNLGSRSGISVMEDLGSGCLVDLSQYGLEQEPTVQDAVATGADLVTFSGDKLLGGPQAGILAGRKEAIECCSRHPLMRALRPDKVTFAALEATLAVYRDPAKAVARLPALAMLLKGEDALRVRAERLAEALRRALQDRLQVAVRQDVSEVGGGSLPLQQLPTWVVELRQLEPGVSRIEAALRNHRPPVIARIREDALVLDPRTLREDEEETVVEALSAATAEPSP